MLKTPYCYGMPVLIMNDNKEIIHEGEIFYIHKTEETEAEIKDSDGQIKGRYPLANIQPAITVLDYGAVKVIEGKSFKVDLVKHTLKIGDKTLIDGQEHALPLGYEKDEAPRILHRIESLYDAYRHSIPSENDSRHPSKHFIALKEDDLSDEDMLYGEKRNLAQFRLECYILCEILKGTLTKEIFGDKWFWQSTKHPDLIILKSWF